MDSNTINGPIYCRKCKKPIAADAAFCSACGHDQSKPFVPTPPLQPAKSTVPAPEADVPQIAVAGSPAIQATAINKNSSNTGWIIPTALLLLSPPTGCITWPLLLLCIALVCSVGGVGALAALVVAAIIFRFSPILLGLAVAVAIWRAPSVPQEKKPAIFIGTVAVGVVLNMLLIYAMDHQKAVDEVKSLPIMMPNPTQLLMPGRRQGTVPGRSRQVYKP